MSASAYLASLSVQGQPVFYFACAVTEWGHIPDRWLVDQEVLADRGVDFDRWRDIRWRYPKFVMATIEDDTSFDNAAARMISYLKALNTGFATLTYVAGGVRKTFRRVKLHGVGPHPQDPKQQLAQAAILYGYGASVGSAAVLMAQWTLQLTEPAS